MHATAEQVRPEFKGSSKQKELAQKVFDLTSASARFFSPDAAINVSLDVLAEHLSEQDGADAETIEAALTENEHVFTREEWDGTVYFLTTRNGVAPVREEEQGSTHSFARRFQEPPPVPDYAPPKRRPRQQRPADELDLFGAAEAESEAGMSEEEIIAAAVEAATAAPGEPEPAPEAQKPAAAAAEVVADLDDASDEEITQALRDQLAYDYAVASFGDEWMAEDKVPRLSRGDLRRIKDYIAEQGGPVSDYQIVQDLLGIRQSAQEYPLHLFSVNFRLSRETRDFEFVGISGAHLWATSGMSAPDVAHRKASEVGQDYRVLLDIDSEPTMVDEGVVEHVLTFYEHRHGVLPYDSTFQSIIPGPVLEGQRSAIIQFESPLTSQSFPIEVRFPTGNRGGYLAGFSEFFKEHLVPGAFVTIEAGDKPGTYTIEFLTVSGQDRKLLEFDDKKQQYKFESRTFYCAPNEDMLVAENRFPKLAGATQLDDRSRRQPERVLSHAFSFAGERIDSEGDQIMAVMDELVAAANIERPMPAELIRAIATSEDHPEFSIDPEADDVVYYRPGPDTESAS
jgi:hypothetical protein